MDQFDAVCFVFENSACFFKIYEREGRHVLGVEKLTRQRDCCSRLDKYLV